MLAKLQFILATIFALTSCLPIAAANDCILARGTLVAQALELVVNQTQSSPKASCFASQLFKVSTLEVHVAPTSGSVVPENLELLFDARMPEHNHGMVVKPKITKVGPQLFRVEGVKLHMPGFWEFQITLKSGVKIDNVRLAYQFNP